MSLSIQWLVMSRASQPLLYVRQDIGTGNPIVLLHGMFGDGTQWESIAELLSKNFRVIVVDLLGHGKSPKPADAQYTAAEHSSALRATLEKIDAINQLTVAGYSMGGIVAMQYAADYQDITQLYLISTPFYLAPADMVAAGYANSLAYTKASVAIYKIIDKLLHPGKLLYRASKSDFLMKSLQKLVHAYDNQLDPEIARLNLAHLVADYPFMQVLATISVPITFFSGTRDVFVVHSQLQALKKVQPYMEIQTLPIVKNDHMLVQLLPNTMAGILSQYARQELAITNNVGKGETIVLLHGIESASSYWDNIIPDLTHNYRVVTVDLLGFGKSPHPLNIAYTLDEQVMWLKRTLKAYNINTFHLVGHSLGALVALAYAETHAHDVTDLSLISPVFFIEGSTKKFIVNRLRFAHQFSATSYLASVVTRAVGAERIRPFVPTVRSIENSVKEQKTLHNLSNLKSMPTTVIYGARDPLVDEDTLQDIAHTVPLARITRLEKHGHNPSLVQPKEVLKHLPFTLPKQLQAQRSTVITTSFFKQLVKLAYPVLIVKGAIYLTVGTLLFSQYKQETLVIAVTTAVIYQGIALVRGSFSLKNENLAYISHIFIGICAIIAGLVLHNHFDISLRLAVFVCSVLVLLNGITRLLAGYFWTPATTKLRRRQLTIGWLLLLIGSTAQLGSLISVHAIVYGIAAYALLRGGAYVGYAGFTIALAYVRGFQK